MNKFYRAKSAYNVEGKFKTKDGRYVKVMVYPEDSKIVGGGKKYLFLCSIDGVAFKSFGKISRRNCVSSEGKKGRRHFYYLKAESEGVNLSIEAL